MRANSKFVALNINQNIDENEAQGDEEFDLGNHCCYVKIE